MARAMDNVLYWMVDSATTTLYCYVEYGDVESRSSYEGVESRWHVVSFLILGVLAYCARKRSSSGPVIRYV
ncbi:hypothetical protein F442_00388 [Phytophthora nicotianae P10297]|uniref:Uncharacterized protein n=2 Tax=Phytophthora nicotianae TaxID=4792 RepID=W2RGQ7_PHYN3|nr:hypothetical protein PPTG_20710 [Phytophthora nicotianae INRA-310]ETN23804.1 hypothetical protein PPTG_20710 [Phytophthora nicotianae INRA-310]ETP54987.1 hypothetical protein F442_00388 [Phytophthora nicotianae P10297]